MSCVNESNKITCFLTVKLYFKWYKRELLYNSNENAQIKNEYWLWIKCHDH